MGVGPIGSTQAGALSSWLGAPWAMAIGASIAGLTVVAVRVVKPAVFTRPATPEDQPIVT
jgi:hypothetical protein